MSSRVLLALLVCGVLTIGSHAAPNSSSRYKRSASGKESSKALESSASSQDSANSNQRRSASGHQSSANAHESSANSENRRSASSQDSSASSKHKRSVSEHESGLETATAWDRNLPVDSNKRKSVSSQYNNADSNQRRSASGHQSSANAQESSTNSESRRSANSQDSSASSNQRRSANGHQDSVNAQETSANSDSRRSASVLESNDNLQDSANSNQRRSASGYQTSGNAEESSANSNQRRSASGHHSSADAQENNANSEGRRSASLQDGSASAKQKRSPSEHESALETATAWDRNLPVDSNQRKSVSSQYKNADSNQRRSVSGLQSSANAQESSSDADSRRSASALESNANSQDSLNSNQRRSASGHQSSANSQVSSANLESRRSASSQDSSAKSKQKRSVSEHESALETATAWDGKLDSDHLDRKSASGHQSSADAQESNSDSKKSASALESSTNLEDSSKSNQKESVSEVESSAKALERALVNATAPELKQRKSGDDLETLEGRIVARGSTKFLKEVVANSPGQSVVTSPLGLLTLLALYSKGAPVSVQSQLSKVFNSKSFHEVDKTYKSLSQQFDQIVPENFLQLTNKIYVAKRKEILESFKKFADEYRSEYENIDFYNSEKACETINKWVEGKTHGLIKSVVDPNTLDRSTVLAMFNVIYFKGTWNVPFNPAETKPHDFNVNSYVVVRRQMMRLKERLPYYESRDLNAKLVALPYQEEGYRMVVILPNEVEGLKSVVQKMSSGDKFYDAVAKLEKPGWNKVDLLLPKFETHTNQDLTNLLKKMGLGKMFEIPARGILDDPVVAGKVIQDAFIKVDEKGTEAAAVSAIGIMGSAAIPPMIEIFHAKHPFIYAILNQDIVMFIGTYTR